MSRHPRNRAPARATFSLERIVRILAVIAFALAGEARAGAYDVDTVESEAGVLSIGLGYDPLSNEKKLFRCFDAVEFPQATSSTANLEIDFARSRSEVLSSLKIDIEAEVHTGFIAGAVSLEADFERATSSASTENTVSLVIKASETAPSIVNVLTGSSLNATGRMFASLIPSLGAEAAFYEPCGREVVLQADREWRFAIVIDISASSQQQAESVASSLSASYSAANADGSVSADIATDWRRSISQARTKIRLFSRGCPLGELGSVVGDPGNLPAIFQSVQSAFGACFPDNGVRPDPQAYRYVTAKTCSLVGLPWGNCQMLWIGA